VLLGSPLAAGVAAHEGVHAHACGSLVVCARGGGGWEGRRRLCESGGWWGETLAIEKAQYILGHEVNIFLLYFLELCALAN
jgi:hypothetical protein